MNIPILVRRKAH